MFIFLSMLMVCDETESMSLWARLVHVHILRVSKWLSLLTPVSSSVKWSVVLTYNESYFIGYVLSEKMPYFLRTIKDFFWNYDLMLRCKRRISKTYRRNYSAVNIIVSLMTLSWCCCCFFFLNVHYLQVGTHLPENVNLLLNNLEKKL